MNNALYNIKNGEYNRFCEELPHNEQCECCDQQCCPCEPSESTELVQSDWNQKDSTLPDYIRNKPVIPNQQIQSDWDQLDDSKKDFIKNKPVIPDAQVQSNWSETNQQSKAYIRNKPTIPDTSNFIQKSSTAGLVKNDGSIDTTQYLTLHLDISGKADKSEMSVVPGTDANADKTTITLKQGTSATVLTVHQDISGKANTTDLATVATSGSYDDLSGKPTIPAAQVQSDWNESNTTSKAYINNKPTNVSAFTNDAGYLTQHQDLTNYIQKSQIAGLLKNDGTVDTAQYTTNTGTITGITMNGQSKGTSGNVDLGTVITDVSGKEDITPIEAVTSGTTAITAQANKYYDVAGTVSSLTVTLPTPTVNTEITMVVVHFTAAANNPVVFVTSSATVAYSAAYAVVANKEYELSCLYNGSKWIVSSMEVAV